MNSNQKYNGELDPTQIKKEMHERYDEKCRKILNGELESQPAQKSPYSSSPKLKFPLSFKEIP